MYVFNQNLYLYSRSPDKPKVLILAPTEEAAINIDGTTINSGQSTPCYVNAHFERGRTRNLYHEVLVVLIDEISMASNIRSLHIHKRLYEILGCEENQPFSSLSVLLVFDLLRLPPVRAPQIFEPYNNRFGDFFNW